jgi:pimeloyl-ACP methyl ester carboxylesterase
MTTRVMESAAPAAMECPPFQEADVFVMPCSISQNRFWLLDQLYPNNPALSIPLAVRFDGPLDIAILERALNAIVARHEVLRTSFEQIEGTPKQVIYSEVQLRLDVIDLRDVPDEKRKARVEQEMIAEAARPLSLTQPPVLRTVLLLLGAEENVLMLTLQHIVCDGWSNGLIVSEVGIFYHAFRQGKEPNLPPLALQYADYALWQQEWLKSPRFLKQLAYWKETLEGDLPVLDMPTDFPRRKGQTYTAYIESLLLPTGLTESIRRLCVELDVTLFMVFFATYVTLLYRYTGQRGFLIGTTAANRNRSELEHLIGLFANPLILHPKISGEATFRELAVQLRDQSLEGFSRQEVPFEIVLEELQNSKTGKRKPSLQTHFLFQKAFMEPATYGDVTIKPLRSVSPGSTFELTYGIVERTTEGIRLQMEYHTALYQNSTIRRMLRHFQRLLEAAVEDPDVSVSELALLTNEEQEKANAISWPKELTAEGFPTEIDSEPVLQDLQSQLEKHFQEAIEPQAVSLEVPAGVIPVVLDSRLRSLPAGIPGTLYLGGVTSAAASLNPLVQGPLDAPTTIPLLRTDFVARNGESGKIELLGRFADFARIDGFQVNLRQVKALLERHPGVEEAAAVLTSLPATGDRELNCYFVPKPGAVPKEKELLTFLEGKISDFTLPVHILTVPALAKNAKGDVQVELLPSPVEPVKPADQKIPLEAILYQQLIEIWMEILKVPRLTIEDNFFALGGSSLLALRMMTQIEKLCGRPLPLSLLLTGATISNLARYIIEANSESAAPVVTVQSKGNRPPLFFLHGDWAGGGFYCGQLSQQMGEDQPFYALPPHRSGKQSVQSLEEMAAFHIAAIREHSPRGPYLLGGYCIGATVAMEIARQLVAQGEKVTRLLLIDPPQLGARWLRVVWPLIDKIGRDRHWDLQKRIYYFDRYAVSLSRWLRKPARNKWDSLVHRLGLARSAGTAVVSEANEGGMGDTEILNSLDYAVYFLAYRIYDMRPFSVPATLYFPEETPPSRLSWVKRSSRNIPDKVIIELIPGNHHTCITRYTPVLADRMRKTIDRI